MTHLDGYAMLRLYAEAHYPSNTCASVKQGGTLVSKDADSATPTSSVRKLACKPAPVKA
jgi:hypothetical protein